MLSTGYALGGQRRPRAVWKMCRLLFTLACAAVLGGHTSIGTASGDLRVLVRPDYDPPEGIERVSVATDGTPGNGECLYTSISADGRYVAFHTYSNNLLPDDSYQTPNVFVRDRQLGITHYVSVANDGTEGCGEWASISANGRFVAFQAESCNLGKEGGQGIFVRDLQAGGTEKASVRSDGNTGRGFSRYASISADGRYVAFDYNANDLVPGDDNMCEYGWECLDVFVHDRQTGATERVSVASDGSQGNQKSYSPAISADGRYVAFYSEASNLVPGDTNQIEDLFVHDRQTGATERVSVSSNGTQQNNASIDYFPPSISADGRYVAFSTPASNLVAGVSGDQVYIHDRQAHITWVASVSSSGVVANGGGNKPSISADGRYVAFDSGSNNLVPNDHYFLDVFVHDNLTGSTVRVSAVSGEGGNGTSNFAAISGDGRSVAFRSFATNLVSSDINGVPDAFVGTNPMEVDMHHQIYLPMVIR